MNFMTTYIFQRYIVLKCFRNVAVLQLILFWDINCVNWKEWIKKKDCENNFLQFASFITGILFIVDKCIFCDKLILLH